MMAGDSTIRDLVEYLRQNPGDTKLPQIIKTWIGSKHPGIKAAQHPDTTHLRIIIEICDNRLLWMNPDIRVKIC